MYLLFVILMVIAALLMCFIVLIQNSKGGGLASGFSSSNAIMGVRKTTDFLEKATWGLAIFMVVMSIAVYWKAYSKKLSSKPSKSELTKVESMRQYGSATYHNTGLKKGMTESIVFDKSHAGYNGGIYIYYYVECKNSVGSDESPISYEIVKR